MYSLEVFKFATACTPTKYRCFDEFNRLHGHEMASPPKANQMSVPTSNMFRWPSHISDSRIDSINLILQIDMRCFFWFQKLKLLQVCMTQRNFAVWQGRLVMECPATNGHAPRQCLVPSITKKGRHDKPVFLRMKYRHRLYL